jgi:two-component system, OmpR family, response regulator CpxR
MERQVLVVEDDPDIQESLKLLLEEEGCCVATADNGAVALEMLGGDAPPKLILLDLMMPVMSGWEFLERVREDDRLNQIPIVVVTAAGEQREAPEGAIKLMRKPLNLEALLGLIRQYC